MIVHSRHRNDPRTPSPTATELPAAAPSLVVAVFGHPGRIAGLARQLPAGWALRRPANLADLRPGEIVLIVGASVDEVADARARAPRQTRIVALVDALAPAEVVTGVLSAGADVCVRGGHPAVLAGHLVACRRRQLTDRWSQLAVGDA